MDIKNIVPWSRKGLQVRSDEEDPFVALQSQVNQVFDHFFNGFAVNPLWGSELRTGTFNPRLDFTETDKEYRVTVELPGLDEKNIEVKVVNGNLTIKGEKQEEKEEKKKDYYLHERHFGSFERSFEIPEGVDADKIEANFKKGVLTVTLPKKPEAQKPAKKIEVRAA